MWMMMACPFWGIAFRRYVYDSLHVIFRLVFMPQENRLSSMSHFITGGLPAWKTSSCQNWLTFSSTTNPHSHRNWRRIWLISWKQFFNLFNMSNSGTSPKVHFLLRDFYHSAFLTLVLEGRLQSGEPVTQTSQLVECGTPIHLQFMWQLLSLLVKWLCCLGYTPWGSLSQAKNSGHRHM